MCPSSGKFFPIAIDTSSGKTVLVILGELGHHREIKHPDSTNVFPIDVDTFPGTTILAPGIPSPIVIRILSRQWTTQPRNRTFRTRCSLFQIDVDTSPGSILWNIFSNHCRRKNFTAIKTTKDRLITDIKINS